MTVVKTMENTLNPSLVPCKSELRKPVPRAKRAKKTEAEYSLEVEIINGKRKSRRGRPSQCTEFWLMYKANSEKQSESADAEPKSQIKGEMSPASEKKSLPTPSSEKSPSSLPTSHNSPTSMSSQITSLEKLISTNTYTNELPNPVFLPSTSIGTNSRFSPFLPHSPTLIPSSHFSNFMTATPNGKRKFSEKTDGNEQVPSKRPDLEIPKTNTTAQDKRRKQPKTDIRNSGKCPMIKEHDSTAVKPITFGTTHKGSSNERNCLLGPVDLSPPSSRSAEQNDNREHFGLPFSQNSPVQPGLSTVSSSVAVRHLCRFIDAIPSDHLEKTTSTPKTIPGLTTLETAFNTTRAASVISNSPRSENIIKELQFSSGQIREFVRDNQTSWMKNPETLKRFDPFLTESTRNVDSNQECLNLSSKRSANLSNSLEAHSSRKISGANTQRNPSTDLPEDLSSHALDLSTSKVPLDLRCL